jgi:Glyoxalase-like domain
MRSSWYRRTRLTKLARYRLVSGDQGWCFVPVPEGKNVKNRLHIDLAPPEGEDQAAEVRRLEALGASRVDVGQDPGQVTWVVLADPEGNEFCVLSARD